MVVDSPLDVLTDEERAVLARHDACECWRGHVRARALHDTAMADPYLFDLFRLMHAYLHEDGDTSEVAWDRAAHTMMYRIRTNLVHDRMAGR